MNSPSPIPPTRLMLIADFEHPFVYRSSFPRDIPEVDMVLGAGDLAGSYLEFVATKLPRPVLYVPGNHGNEKLIENGVSSDPGGVTNLHGKVLEVGGLVVAGWGGAPKYREKGEGQYTPLEAWHGFAKLAWQLRLRKLAGKRPLDILLTHAPPLGPHAGSDFAHRGCVEMTKFIAHFKPRLVVHGHIHEYEGRKLEYTTPEGTRVINAYGYRVVELAPASEKTGSRVESETVNI